MAPGAPIHTVRKQLGLLPAGLGCPGRLSTWTLAGRGQGSLPPRELPELSCREVASCSLSEPCHCFAFQGSDDEEEGQKVPPPPETPMPPPLPPTPDQVIVRKDYDPKGRVCFPALGLPWKVLHVLVYTLDWAISRRSWGNFFCKSTDKPVTGLMVGNKT